MTVQPYRKRGEITIFLALLLSVVCAFIGVIIESARTQALRYQIESVMTAGLHSCFGEFHQELFNRYDLLYIDASYKKAIGTIEQVSSHLKQYIEKNMEGERTGDLFQLSVEDMIVHRYQLASDNRGHELRYQAVQYLREFGDSSHCIVTDRCIAETSQIAETDFEAQWDGILNRIRSYGKSFINPAEKVRETGKENMVSLLTGGKGALFTIPYQDIPSNRRLMTGNYVQRSKTINQENKLFDEYLLQKCGDYSRLHKDSVLHCELEYILYGDFRDQENLKQVINKLMKMRQSINLKLLFSDEGKCEEADRLAKKLVGIFEIPGLVDAVREAILYAWAHAESAIEVSRLLNGGRAEISKNSSSWILPLEELLEFREYMGEKAGQGFSYTEYLGAFLHEINEDLKIRRFMDLAEINIRQKGQSNFRIDGCVTYMEAEVFFKSVYGYYYQIRRDFGYDE